MNGASVVRSAGVVGLSGVAGWVILGCCCGSGVDTGVGGGGVGGGETMTVSRSDLGMVCATQTMGLTGNLAIPVDGDGDMGEYAETSQLVRELIRDMGENAGLRRSSIPPVYADPSVGDSVAVAATLLVPVGDHEKGQRLILYSPQHVKEHTERSGSTGTIMFIFGHELGHHVNGHNVARPGVSSHEKELEADYYAGFLMGLAGERKRDTVAWIEANVPDQDSASHPGRSKRLKSAVEGWEKGCGQIGTCNE